MKLKDLPRILSPTSAAVAVSYDEQENFFVQSDFRSFALSPLSLIWI